MLTTENARRGVYALCTSRPGASPCRLPLAPNDTESSRKVTPHASGTESRDSPKRDVPCAFMPSSSDHAIVRVG